MGLGRSLGVESCSGLCATKTHARSRRSPLLKHEKQSELSQLRLTKRTFAIFGGPRKETSLGRLRPTVGRVGALTEMSKRLRSDYETGDDATRAGLDPKSDGGGLLAEYILQNLPGIEAGLLLQAGREGPSITRTSARGGEDLTRGAIGAVAADGAVASDAALMPPPKPRAPGPAVQLDPTSSSRGPSARLSEGTSASPSRTRRSTRRA